MLKVKPKSYPQMLIDKDWSQRPCFVWPQMEQNFIDQIHDLEVRNDDVWLVGLPKSGTTWMNELLWLVMNDFDFEMAKQTPLEVRSPLLEFMLNFTKYKNDPFKKINDLKSPRLIKTHSPLPLVPHEIWTKKPKVVYIFRNPKDAVVSSYHFSKNFSFLPDGPKNTSLDQYVKNMIEFETATNANWNHVTEFYRLRNEPWIYYTSFENLKKNLRKEINGICKFLNKIITEEQMTNMLQHLSYEEMKVNPHVNSVHDFKLIREYYGVKEDTAEKQDLVRQGEVGSYKKELSKETADELNKWVTKSLAEYNVTLEQLLLLKP